jgi:hypothetical protein
MAGLSTTGPDHLCRGPLVDPVRPGDALAPDGADDGR